MRFAIWFILCATSILVSCGGGSGGAGGGGSVSTSSSTDGVPGSTASVSIDTSPINIKYVYGNANQTLIEPASSSSLSKLVTVTGVNLSSPPDNFFLAYFSDDDAINLPISIFIEQISSSTLRARVSANSTLVPGNYTGSLTVVACMLNITFDDCDTHLVGSPSKGIPFSVTVFPVLSVQDGWVSMQSASQGRKAPVTSTSVITGSISKDDLTIQTNYESSSINWLTTTRTDAGFEYAIYPESLPLGNHTATVRLSSKASLQTVEKTIVIIVGSNTYSGISFSQQVTVNDTTTDPELRTEIPVGLDDATLVIPWRATTSVPWIILENDNGVTGQKLAYRISKSHLALMAAEQAYSSVGVTGSITITNSSTYTIAPFSIAVNLRKEISDLSRNTGPSVPISMKGYPVYLSGKNLSPNTVYETSEPSQLAIAGDGTILTAPSIAGSYTVKTKNALGIPTNPVTLEFLANAQHSYRFLPLSGYNRSIAYDHQRDSLYVVDKTRNQLTRFQHSAGTWTQAQRPMPNISDLGLSKDGKRLYVSRTSGVLHRIDLSSFTVDQTMTFGQPFPEYRQLSQNLPVLGLGKDYVSMMTTYTASAWRELSGIATWSTQDNSFMPTSGYDYKPERGGWFAKSQLADTAYFTQALPRGFDTSDLKSYGDYAGIFSGLGLTPSAFMVSFPLINPFSSFDTGLTTARQGAGIWNRTSVYGYYSTVLPSLPAGHQTIGSVISADWQYLYLLAYPDSAINGDLPTSQKPRIYIYKLDLENFPMVRLLPGYTEINDYPTCRRAADSTCLLDTVSAVSMDGKTLFFAGDKGVIVVPDPAPSRLLAAAARESVVRIQPAQIGTLKFQKSKPVSTYSAPNITSQ